MAYRDSTAVTTTGTSINASKPTLLQTGDILLCYLITDIGLNAPAPTITPPAGWALITGSNQGANSSAPDGFTSWVYWKLANNSEPATWNFAQNGGSTQMIAIVTCHSGRNPNPTFITHGTVNTTGNATPVTVSDTGVTAIGNDDIIVFATGDITVGTDTWGFSPPTNYTERQDTQVSFDVATAATRDEVFSGATGTLSLTLTRSAGTGTSGWGIFVIAIPQMSLYSPVKFPAYIPNLTFFSKIALPLPASPNTANGSNTYNVDIVESGTATEAEDATKITLADITESATATETEATTLVTNAVILESATATETEDATKALAAVITEAATATEAEDATKNVIAAITESGTATEASDATKVLLADIAESATATDAQNDSLVTLANVTEAATADSAQNSSLITLADISEPVTAIDVSDATTGGGIIYNVSISESAAADDVTDAEIIPMPPVPIAGGGGGGSANFGHRNERKEQQEQERRRINEILREDEIILALIQSFMTWE